MKVQTFEKSLKMLLARHIIIVPFTGNLTEEKKTKLAKFISNFINEKFNKNVSEKDVFISAFEKAYASVEKDLKVKYHDDRISLSGDGWSSSNYSKKEISILENFK